MTLVAWDDPILTTTCAEFTDWENAEALAKVLLEQLQASNGIGIAAPQAGFSTRLFVLATDPVLAVFNPRVVDTSTEGSLLEEACLSFPGLVGKVRRPSMIRARFQTPNGETVTKQFSGMTARAFLHEMDHLDGRPFFARMGRTSVELMARKAAKRGHKYDVGRLLKIARGS